MTRLPGGQSPIADYAYLGDGRSGALVSSGGSVDWWCAPRFDAPACFARILGDEDNGHWTLAPTDPVSTTRRGYLDDSLVLCTEHVTSSGTVRIVDCLAIEDDRHAAPRLVRLVEGQEGSVAMSSRLRIRFDYGSIVPWVRRTERGITAVGGPDALVLDADVEHHPEGFSTRAEFTVRAGHRFGFVLTSHPSHQQRPSPRTAEELVAETVSWWRTWVERISYDGDYAADVRRSLVVLKGLSSRETGGFVAAPTTSLPEWTGGSRNWNYRYCWLRDAAFTLEAMLASGCTEEAVAWRDWLVRAVGGDPGGLQIMYGLAGERRLPESVLDWLPGHANTRPVRVGNGAWEQIQLDVYGEVAETLALARAAGMQRDDEGWNMQLVMLDWLEGNWDRPDDGIWETRGGRARHTLSQVMSWVAFDRAARMVEQHQADGDASRWRALAADIHRTICAEGVNESGVFTQAFGSNALDASTLLIPIVGFLPPEDGRVTATIAAIERELTTDGLVHRYSTEETDDGVGGKEGAFLLCNFWMVDALALSDRVDEARCLYERLLDLRNDVGLLAEQYDPSSGQLLGNFPQAFSHVGIVNSAAALCGRHTGASQKRSART